MALIRSRLSTPAETLRARWPGPKNLLLQTVKWSALGGALGSIVGAAGCAITAGVSQWSITAGAAVFGPAGAAVFALAGAIASLIDARAAGVRRSPTLALRNSLRSTAICFIGAAILSLPFVWIREVNGSHFNDWLDSAILGCELLPWMALFIALEKGGYFLLDHFATRYLLYRKDLIPWDLVRFLDTAAERIFLRKVGGSYIFVHRSLLEYFASQFESEPPEAPPSEAQQRSAVAPV